MYTVPKLDDYSPAALDRAMADLIGSVKAEKELVGSGSDWKAFRDRWLARKNGILAQVNEIWLKAAPPEAKRDVGQRVNQLKEEVNGWVKVGELLGRALDLPAADQPRVLAHAKDIIAARREAQLSAERLDITLPGIRRPIGVKHPVLRVQDEIVAVFKAMGYSVGEGPEVETDYYNFESLNFPPNHPARDTQDTIFIAGQERKPAHNRLLLRTHTSPVQIRSMEKLAPPVRIVIPGKVHRNDPLDATHSPVFHQVEGLVVDQGISMADLKGTVTAFLEELFGKGTRTRFIPTFFPFVEPGVDVSMSCIFCGGSGCPKCKGSGWIEIMGAGMVHPRVLQGVAIDPEEYTGFAFGLGLDRVALLKYGFPDLRLLFEGDERFLGQFVGVA